MKECDNCGEMSVIDGSVTRHDTGETVKATICTASNCGVIETTEYWDGDL